MFSPIIFENIVSNKLKNKEWKCLRITLVGGIQRFSPDKTSWKIFSKYCLSSNAPYWSIKRSDNKINESGRKLLTNSGCRNINTPKLLYIQQLELLLNCYSNISYEGHSNWNQICTIKFRRLGMMGKWWGNNFTSLV